MKRNKREKGVRETAGRYRATREVVNDRRRLKLPSASSVSVFAVVDSSALKLNTV